MRKDTKSPQRIKMNTFENAIVDFYNHYHTKSKTHDKLYQYSDTTFQITYPVTLHDFVMEGTGNHGKTTGYSPIGTPIIECEDAAKALKNIFSSVESLKTWILDNRVKGVSYERFAGVKAVKKRNEVQNSLARMIFWTKFDKSKQDAMFHKYGKACVVNDLTKLTWNEFDLRYGMEG